MSILTDALAGQVVEAVRRAGSLLTAPSAVQTVVPKSRTDFVTNVDLTVQNTLRGQLEQLAPAVQFLGEEGEKAAIDLRRPFWILDPVDGTTNLIHQFGHSAVSLALAENGQICFGIVYQPYTGECFTARRGKGAFLNGRPIRVSGADRLADSLLSTGTVPGRRDLADQAFYQMRALYDRCQDIRRAGCASLDLCWVACGRRRGTWSWPSSPGTMPPVCFWWRRQVVGSPPPMARPSPFWRAAACWPPMDCFTQPSSMY